MRILRIAALVVFIICLALNIVVTARYNARKDTTAPVIQSETNHLELTVSQGLDALTQGLTAYDKEDGDLTDQILVAGTSYFTEKGTIKVDYVVFDAGHNAGHYSRTVTFTDYESPRFYLDQPLVFYRTDNIRYLNYIRATDSLEGDITGQIKVLAGEVSNYTSGVYPVILEVGNRYGDRVQIQVSVVVKDPSASGPEIILSSYIAYVEQGQRFDPMTMLRSVRAYGTGESIPLDQVTILGSVDTGIPGSYQLVYSCTQNGREGRAYLTVVVEGE